MDSFREFINKLINADQEKQAKMLDQEAQVLLHCGYTIDELTILSCGKTGVQHVVPSSALNP